MKAPSLFKPYNPADIYRGAYWPAGGTEIAYRTMLVNNAIDRDKADELIETIARGWLTPECRTFDNGHIIDHCLRKGAVACALELRNLGWPEWQRRAT